jgi:hypothetical protein
MVKFKTSFLHFNTQQSQSLVGLYESMRELEQLRTKPELTVTTLLA